VKNKIINFNQHSATWIKIDGGEQYEASNMRTQNVRARAVHSGRGGGGGGNCFPTEKTIFTIFRMSLLINILYIFGAFFGI
jgi:hypothetical protein